MMPPYEDSAVTRSLIVLCASCAPYAALLCVTLASLPFLPTAFCDFFGNCCHELLVQALTSRDAYAVISSRACISVLEHCRSAGSASHSCGMLSRSMYPMRGPRLASHRSSCRLSPTDPTWMTEPHSNPISCGILHEASAGCPDLAP